MSTDPLRHLAASVQAILDQQEHARRVADEVEAERERALVGSPDTLPPSSPVAPAPSSPSQP